MHLVPVRGKFFMSGGHAGHQSPMEEVAQAVNTFAMSRLHRPGAVKSVVVSVVPTGVMSRNVWDFVQSQAARAAVGMTVKLAHQASDYVFTEIVEAFSPKKEAHLQAFTQAVANADPIIQKYDKLHQMLSLLVNRLTGVVKGRDRTLKEGCRSLVEHMQVVQDLGKSVEILSEEDVERALDLLQKELEDVIDQHKRNVLMFPEILDTLEKSGVEQQRAQDALKKAKEEQEDVVLEIEALNLMLLAESQEVCKGIDMLIRGDK